MSMFRLRSIPVPAMLLKQSISNTLNFVCVSAVTVHVTALYLYISIASTVQNRTLSKATTIDIAPRFT